MPPVPNCPIRPCGKRPKKMAFTCGVYQILHRQTKRRYVGSSTEVEKRVYHHIVQLRTGKHHCRFLQNMWNKYGEEQFEFILIERCSLNVVEEREQFHLDYQAEYQLVNARKTALVAAGFSHSDATKSKMSESAKRRAASPEEKAVRSARARAQHAAGNLGQATWGEAAKLRVAELVKRPTVFSPSVINKIYWLMFVGFNQYEVAKVIGTSQSGVSTALRRAKAERRGERGRVLCSTT